MAERNRMAVMADLLAQGREPDEVTLLAIVHHELIDLINREVHFALVADNIDRPDARYGTGRDGEPSYAPAWYVAQGIKTGLHEALYGTLKAVLGCDSVDEHGHKCLGSLAHETCHWDGNGCNWDGPNA